MQRWAKRICRKSDKGVDGAKEKTKRFGEETMNLLLCGEAYIEEMWGGGGRGVEEREIRQVGL